jgi:hypothetical protein
MRSLALRRRAANPMMAKGKTKIKLASSAGEKG